jgi:hypothetical protein
LDESLVDIRTAKKRKVPSGDHVDLHEILKEPVSMMYVDSDYNFLREYKRSDILIYELSIAVTDCAVGNFKWENSTSIRAPNDLRVSF